MTKCTISLSDDPLVKHSGSPPSAHSPRSVTPKRTPLIFPAHSAGGPSSLTSPPVVTIAPTQAHHHQSLSSADLKQVIYAILNRKFVFNFLSKKVQRLKCVWLFISLVLWEYSKWFWFTNKVWFFFKGWFILSFKKVEYLWSQLKNLLVGRMFTLFSQYFVVDVKSKNFVTFWKI